MATARAIVMWCDMNKDVTMFFDSKSLVLMQSAEPFVLADELWRLERLVMSLTAYRSSL